MTKAKQFIRHKHIDIEKYEKGWKGQTVKPQQKKPWKEQISIFCPLQSLKVSAGREETKRLLFWTVRLVFAQSTARQDDNANI